MENIEEQVETNELELYKWQPAGVEFLRTRPGALLGDEQGLGKTIMVIEAAKKFDGPVLCIVRPLAKLQISMMIKMWDPGTPIVRCIDGGIFAQDVVKEWFSFPRRRGYLLVHHEIVYRIQSILKDLGIWEIVWVDEAHRMANPKTQISKAIKSIPSFYKWGTSGTIQDRSPADFWSPLNWFQPQKFSAYHAFYNRYVEEQRSPRGIVYHRRPRNMSQFAQEVGPFYLRRTAEEVGMFLPIFEPVALEMGPKQRQVYDTIAKEVLVFLERESTDDPIFVSNSLKKMSLLTRCTVDPTSIDVNIHDSVKFEWVKDHFLDYPNEQFVVFTHNKHAAKTLAAFLPKALPLTGDLTDKQRDSVLELFLNGEVPTMVATTDIASESLSFPDVHKLIFLDIHPSSRSMSQAEMRVRRANSKRQPHIYYLLAYKTVDELMYKRYKQKLTDRQVVDQYLKEAHNGK